METYLFKFSACLTIFWLVYILFLERQTMHRFKRFYLLATVAAALIIPALTITQYIEPVVTDFEVLPVFIPMDSSFAEIPQVQAPFMDLETMLWIIYGLGVLLFALRFLVNFYKMYQRISDHETITKRSFIYVLLEECRIPHSFFKYLFFDRSKYETNLIPDEVKLHEETHAKQLHSLDIIIIELLQIVFWFHPLIYILKHHIKLNHEFLADQAVLEQGADTKTYQNILLQFSSNTDEYQLSSAINYSSIKKRFTVMKTQTSKTRIWLSSLLLLPIIAILFYSFAEKEYVEKESFDTSEVLQIENDKTNEGATEAMMQEYNDWMKKLNTNSSGLFIPVGTWERLVAIYDLMSEAQRNSVETHPILQEITPELYSVEPSIPTTSQFESWKNEKEFAIWLDRKHISNSELNNYKINDIAHYTGSKVQKNARNQKFPQPFQFKLYTKDGFNTFYTEAYVRGYKEICNEYSIAVHDFLKGSQTDNSELRILKAQADKFYNQFTKEDLDKYNILPAPPVPGEKQEKATPKQIAEYNALAKKYNAQPKDQRVIPSNDLKQLESIYRLMSSNQKDESLPFPECNLSTTQEPPIMWILINRNDQLLVDDELGTLESIDNKLKKLAKEGKSGRLVAIKYNTETSKEIISKVVKLVNINKFKIASFDVSEIPPPPPPAPIKQERPTTKHIAEYNAWAKKINTAVAKAEANKNENTYPIIKKKDVEKFERIYNLMTALQKKNAAPFPKSIPPPPPPAPEAKKNDEEAPLPPPPPAPESTLDFVIRMAKANAQFIDEGKVISSEKAIELVKNNPKLNVQAKKTDTKQPVVYFYEKPIIIGKKGKSKN